MIKPNQNVENLKKAQAEELENLKYKLLETDVNHAKQV